MLSPLDLYGNVQFSSVAQSCPTLCDPIDYSTPGFLSFTISWSLLGLMSIESVMPSNHLILCCPLLLRPSIFLASGSFLFIYLFIFSGSFPMSRHFASGGQSIGASVSASVLPMSFKGSFPLKFTGLISCSPRDSQEASPTPQFKNIIFFSCSVMVQLSHPYMTTRKTIALT